MRLGQLSRKIKVKSTEIIDFTELEYGVKLDASLNAKVDDHLAKQIIAHFTEVAEENSAEENKEEKLEVSTENIEESIVENAVKEEEIVDNAASKESENEDASISPELSPNSETETIKAKAEKLEGLKVIGKIDLPPPPPPEMIEIDGVMYDKEVIKQERREERERKRIAAQKRSEERLKKAKLRALENSESTTEDPKGQQEPKQESFAEIRKKEERAFQLRKEKEEKERRIKQEKHYQEKHLISSAPKPKKKVKKSKEVEEIIVKDERPQPKTLLGKFWRWMNSY